MSDKHDSKKKNMRTKAKLAAPVINGGVPIEPEIKAAAGKAQLTDGKIRASANNAHKG